MCHHVTESNFTRLPPAVFDCYLSMSLRSVYWRDAAFVASATAAIGITTAVASPAVLALRDAVAPSEYSVVFDVLWGGIDSAVAKAIAAPLELRCRTGK